MSYLFGPGPADFSPLIPCQNEDSNLFDDKCFKWFSSSVIEFGAAKRDRRANGVPCSDFQ